MNNLFASQIISIDPEWKKDDFIYRCQQICQQLKQDKISTVGLWLEDASQFSCVLLACSNAKITVLLPPNLLPENQKWLEEHSALLFTNELFSAYGKLQKIAEKIPLVESLYNKQSTSEIWIKTSGSSGQAKIIKKMICQMWREAEALADVLPFQPNQPIYVIGSVSIQHLYGLTFRIFLPLQMGWLLGREQLHYPEYLLNESKQYRTLWISSPTLLNHLNLASIEPTMQIEGIISSGGALPEKTALLLRQTLANPIIEIYGSTETGVIAFRKQNGLWNPMPTSQLGVNDQGALWVENAWISHREQTADTVHLNDRNFELLGRIDRIVKLNDKRISLIKMEQDLLNHCYVKDCYIALHPEHQRPVAWLSLTEEGIEILKQQGRKPLIQILRQHLTLTQEKFALPRFWRFSDELPRNSQAKINRADFEQICTLFDDKVSQ